MTRIVCGSLGEFIENLDDTDIEDLYQKKIRVNIINKPLNNENSRDASAFEIIFQASTILQYADDTETLLEMGVSAGLDYIDGMPDKAGSEAATKMRIDLEAIAEEHGWRVMPGVIGY